MNPSSLDKGKQTVSLYYKALGNRDWVEIQVSQKYRPKFARAL